MRRDNVLQIRLTEEEYMDFERRATELGFGISTYARALLLNSKPIRISKAQNEAALPRADETTDKWVERVSGNEAGNGKDVRRTEPVRVAEGRTGASGGLCECRCAESEHGKTGDRACRKCNCQRYRAT